MDPGTADRLEPSAESRAALGKPWPQIAAEIKIRELTMGISSFFGSFRGLERHCTGSGDADELD